MARKKLEIQEDNPTRIDLMTRAVRAFMSEGDNRLVAMNRATEYYNHYRKGKKPKKNKGLFAKDDE